MGVFTGRRAKEPRRQVQGSQALVERLSSEGVDGEATVNQLRATGKQVNYRPELELDLMVDVNGQMRQVTHTQVISPVLIGQLQPGATVPVKVDPNDHSQLVIGI